MGGDQKKLISHVPNYIERELQSMKLNEKKRDKSTEC